MLGVTLWVVLAGAADAQLYLEIQKSVGAEIMPEANRALADYLARGENGLAALFNSREIAHMRDVYEIFRALGRFRAAALPLGLGFVLAALFKNRGWARTLSRGGALALLLFFGPLLFMGIWAAIDFDGAFRAMHRALFDNELWLLNPETDFMIRLLPQAFFEGMALRLAARAALLAPLFPLLMILGPRAHRKLTTKVIT